MIADANPYLPIPNNCVRLGLASGLLRHDPEMFYVNKDMKQVEGALFS